MAVRALTRRLRIPGPVVWCARYGAPFGGAPVAPRSPNLCARGSKEPGPPQPSIGAADPGVLGYLGGRPASSVASVRAGPQPIRRTRRRSGCSDRLGRVAVYALWRGWFGAGGGGAGRVGEQRRPRCDRKVARGPGRSSGPVCAGAAGGLAVLRG